MTSMSAHSPQGQGPHGGPAPSRARPLRAMFQPVVVTLMVGVAFVSVYLAAFHAPAPHGMPVAVVGSPAEVESAQAAIDAAGVGDVDVVVAANEAGARQAVERREVYGALLSGSAEAPARIAVAGANGPAVTQAVTEAFAVVSTPTPGDEVLDLVPLAESDTRGLSIFYTAFGLVLAAFLFGISSSQMGRGLTSGQRMTSLGVFGTLGGVLTALIAGPTGFGAVPAPFLAIAGIVALLALSVGAATLVLIRLAGPAAGTPLSSLLLLILGNATSGGVLPAVFLPGWLAPLHAILPVGAGVRAIQGVAYFQNDGLGRGIAILLLWVGTCSGILLWRDVVQRVARPSVPAAR